MVATLAAQSWALFILRGILAFLIGALAFLAPGPTLAALVLVFAVYAIVDGTVAVMVGLGSPRGPRWLLVVGGIVGVAIGIYAAVNPSATAIALTLLVGAFVLVRGATELAAAISTRNAIQDPWLLGLSGVVSIAFGGYLLAAPVEGALTLVYVVGFYALFAGVMYVAAGIRLHGVVKSVYDATQTTSSSTAA